MFAHSGTSPPGARGYERRNSKRAVQQEFDENSPCGLIKLFPLPTSLTAPKWFGYMHHSIRMQLILNMFYHEI